MTHSLSLVALAATILLAVPAYAQTQVYSAPLLGSSEVPAVTTAGSGFGKVTIDFGLLTMRVEASFSGLSSTKGDGTPSGVTAAHIHCCTAPGNNASVASQSPTFAFPIGATAGTFDQTFDMSLASSYSPGFISNNGGTTGFAFNALTVGLDAGRAYLNVHTNAFPGGEIRGLLAPVPEPETYALMLAGLGIVGWAAQRRRQA